MKNIAILGYGVVGGGITEVINRNSRSLEKFIGDKLNVKYILDLRDFPDSPYADRVVHDISAILDDPEVSIVCETMGGVDPAFDFSMRLMEKGKSVITSNKELVAKRGIQLMEQAQKFGVQYMFEASVGGGIPEIRGMRTSLAGDTITAIDGILNGTTNYILTAMKKAGADFEKVLSEAQRLGYAERNPSADVDGFDAQRKIMILTAVATGYLVREEDVYCETMRNITLADIDAASRWGGSVKLLGSARISEDGAGAGLFVCPFFVPDCCPLARIDDVYNGIRVVSPVTADVMFYGRGAGRLPTAGAVVSDVASIAAGLAEREKKMLWSAAPDGFVKPFVDNSFSYYVRVETASAPETLEKAALVLGDITALEGSPEGCAEFITCSMRESDAAAAFAKGGFGKVVSTIRVMAQ